MKYARQFIETKKRLREYAAISPCGSIPLKESDFDTDGKLTLEGYLRLKKATKYLGFRKDLTLTVPAGYAEGFSSKLEEYIAHEFVATEQEIKATQRKGVLLFLIGIAVFGVINLLDEARLLYEISIVAFWAFTWGAISHLFFEVPSLKRTVIRLLRLVNANVVHVDAA